MMLRNNWHSNNQHSEPGCWVTTISLPGHLHPNKIMWTSNCTFCMQNPQLWAQTVMPQVASSPFCSPGEEILKCGSQAMEHSQWVAWKKRTAASPCFCHMLCKCSPRTCGLVSAQPGKELAVISRHLRASPESRLWNWKSYSQPASCLTFHLLHCPSSKQKRAVSSP